MSVDRHGKIEGQIDVEKRALRAEAFSTESSLEFLDVSRIACGISASIPRKILRSRQCLTFVTDC